jgi:hypothetical protein
LSDDVTRAVSRARKQWAHSYINTPPSDEELAVWEAEALEEMGSGLHSVYRKVLPTTTTFDVNGDLADYRVGLVVWLFEEDE